MVQLFVFGDSITHGFWDPEGGWVQKLRKYIQEDSVGDNENGPTVFNLGVPGDQSEGLSERFRSEMEARTEEGLKQVVIFAVGANDTGYSHEEDRLWVPRERFRENLRGLVEEAKEFTETVIVIGTAPIEDEKLDPIPWAENMSYSEDRMKEYDTVMQEVCDEKEAVYVDLREGLDREKFLDEVEDGIHPTPEGHRMIYSVVRDKLVEKGILG